MTAFDTPLTITGPYRRPRQLLAEQSIHGHTSIHDDATAAALELTGAPIEDPTHFSQFDPLAFGAWGPVWFERPRGRTAAGQRAAAPRRVQGLVPALPRPESAAEHVTG